MSPAEHRLSVLHELCDRVQAISDAFLELGCDECCGFCYIELKTAGKTFLGKEAGLKVNTGFS